MTWTLQHYFLHDKIVLYNFSHVSQIMMIISSPKILNEQRNIKWKLGEDVQEEWSEEPTPRRSINEEPCTPWASQSSDLYSLQIQSLHSHSQITYIDSPFLFRCFCNQNQRSCSKCLDTPKSQLVRGRRRDLSSSQSPSLFSFCMSTVCESGCCQSLASQRALQFICWVF